MLVTTLLQSVFVCVFMHHMNFLFLFFFKLKYFQHFQFIHATQGKFTGIWVHMFLCIDFISLPLKFTLCPIWTQLYSQRLGIRRWGSAFVFRTLNECHWGSVERSSALCVFFCGFQQAEVSLPSLTSDLCWTTSWFHLTLLSPLWFLDEHPMDLTHKIHFITTERSCFVYASSAFSGFSAVTNDCFHYRLIVAINL